MGLILTGEMYAFVTGFFLWYAAGLLALFLHFIIRNFFKKEEIIIKIEDITSSLGLALAGPILYVIPIAKFLFDLAENYGKVKHKVLWRNRRAKNKDILFGDTDDET